MTEILLKDALAFARKGLPENIMAVLDDALAMHDKQKDLQQKMWAEQKGRPEITYTADQIHEVARKAFADGRDRGDDLTVAHLKDLPVQIKLQSSRVADLTADIEKLRLSIANSKNQALELVLCTMEAGKPKYSNDKARNLAVEQILRDDKLYLANIDELGRKECALRTEQIELEHLHNLFRAYLAISNMQGMR